MAEERKESKPLVEAVAEAVEKRYAPPAEAGEELRFDYNGLATRPKYIDRSLLNLFGELTVQPGTCAVITGRDGYQKVYEPGTYSLFTVPLGRTMVQFVDMSIRTRELPPVTSLSKDKWNVTLKAVVHFRVKDPVKVATMANPLGALDAVATSCILAQIESMNHDALTGKPEETGGIDEVAQGILERMRSSPGIEGLEIINVTVAERKGDERRIKIMQDATVEETRILEESRLEQRRHKAILESLAEEKKIAKRKQEIALIEAETARRKLEEQEQVELTRAKLEAEVAKMRRDQQEWEAQMKRREEEWRLAQELEKMQLQSKHEEAMEVVKGMTQIITEAAKKGELGNLAISPRRRPETIVLEGNESVVERGVQALLSLKERIAPPARYLPSLEPSDPYHRLRLEEEKLARIKGAEYELGVRDGRLSRVTVCYRGFEIRVECPPDYPKASPKATIVRPDGKEEPFEYEWDENCFISDLVRDALLERMG